MKKKQLLFYLAFIMSIITIQAQQAFCEEFNQNAITTLQYPGCTGIAEDNVLDNWGVINTGLRYQDTGSQTGAGDVFLFLNDGSCGNGGSWAYNESDYSGNWMEIVGDEGCFCYDFKTFNIASGTINGNSLRIFNGPNPLASSISATFVLNIPVDASRGWVRICAPIAFSDASGNLPSNSNGQWVVNSGNPSDWDALISGVRSIGYYVDVAGGNEQYGIDNICISEDCTSTLTDTEPTNEGSYCCEGENLVENGNFENGINGFISSYSNPGFNPGSYDVSNSASAFNATITDHSFCDDASMYANNDSYLLINGKTQQPAGTTSVIWEQTINVEVDKEHKLCANFKNMPQCTFDILPEIQLEINGQLYGWNTINADPTNPCDWQQINECFRSGDDTTLNIKIHIKEDGNGDGNDLAIDDISVQQKLDQELNISVLHDATNDQITASVNTINTNDDIIKIGEDCLEENNGNQYYWYVYEPVSLPQTTYISPSVPNTFSWSSNIGGFSQQTSGANPAWSLTTTFPNYTFQPNTFYVVGMFVPSCCNSCYDEAWTYQVTYNNQRVANKNEPLSRKNKDFIKSMFKKFDVTENQLDVKPLNNVMLFPNPAKDKLNIKSDIKMVSYQIVDLSGREVKSGTLKTNQIQVSSLMPNMYIVKLKTEDGEIKTSKFIKK